MDSPPTNSLPLPIRCLPIAQLRPAPYNPRKPPSRSAYRKLEQSIREFGLVEPLIWNELTGNLVGGHLRLKILQSLGWSEVPVTVVRLSEAREKALNVVLNNQEAQGRFDSEKLADLLEQLHDLPELELTGFDASVLSALRLEPLAELSQDDATDQVEVILSTDTTTYERLCEPLNALVRQFGLTCHVKRR